MHRDHRAIPRTHCWDQGFCLAWQKPSLSTAPAVAAPPPGNPADFSAPGATPAVPPGLSEACRARELPPLMALLQACRTTALSLSLLFIFPKCIYANITGFLFQPDKKKRLFLPQCVHFPRVRNRDIYIHLSQSILLYFWTGIPVNPEESEKKKDPTVVLAIPGSLC